MNETELTERLRRTQPTVAPSPELELKVARLAAAKASEALRRPHSSYTFGQKVAFGLAGTCALLGLGFAAAFAPRLIHASTLDRAAVNLAMSPFIHTTLYTVSPDGKEQRVGEGFIHGGQGRITCGEDTWTWENHNRLSHYRKGEKEGERQEAWVSGPALRLISFVQQGRSIFYRASATLFTLPDKRIVSQAPYGDERTAIRLDPQGKVTEYETQVWDKGVWKPAARTRIDTQPFSLALLKTDTPKVPLVDRDKEEKRPLPPPLATLKLGQESITINRLFLNPKGEVFLELHQPTGSKQNLQLHLTDSLGKRYVTSYGTAWQDDGLRVWFFPVEQGAALPKQATLTLTHDRRGLPPQEATLTVPLTASPRLLPIRAGEVDLFRERNDHEEFRLSTLARDAWRKEDNTRLLALTDQWLAIRERERPQWEHSRLTTEVWLYRTAALRMLGRLDEARNALEHAKRTWPAGQDAISITQEEALLLAK